MESFLAYCTGNKIKPLLTEYCGARKASTGSTKGKEELPDSPAIVKKFFDCSNMACNNHTEYPSNWQKAKCVDKMYYFCSDDCHNDWADDPSQLGSWSPSSKPESPQPIPTPLNI